MDTENTFRTKTGYCHILPDKIVLTRDGVVGDLAKVTTGNNIARPLTIYGLLALGLLYFAYDNYQKDKLALTIILGLVGLYLIIAVLRSINNSATPVIDRQRIRRTTFKKGIPGLTRPHFVVDFQDDNGKMRKRLIMLPGSLTGEQSETDKALTIMKKEKIITAPNIV